MSGEAVLELMCLAGLPFAASGCAAGCRVLCRIRRG